MVKWMTHRKGPGCDPNGVVWNHGSRSNLRKG